MFLYSCTTDYKSNGLPKKWVLGGRLLTEKNIGKEEKKNLLLNQFMSFDIRKWQ